MIHVKRPMVLIGSRKAFAMAVTNSVLEPRYSLLLERLKTLLDKGGRVPL